MAARREMVSCTSSSPDLVEKGWLFRRKTRRNQQGKLIKDVQSLRIVCVLGAAIAISAPAQTVPTVIHRFSSTNGETPWSPPFEGVDTYLYGTTSAGGAYQNGTIYKLNPEGKQDWVYPFFCDASGCPDGSTPLAGIIQGIDLWLYGTTWLGGANSAGTVFQIQTDGKHLLTIHSFCEETNCGDGTQPTSTMVAGYTGNTGNEYGTTAYGSEGGYGTIFGIEGAGERDLGMAGVFSVSCQTAPTVIPPRDR